MTRTLTVIFDGNVLRPEGDVDLEPNTRYRITIERAAGPADAGDSWTSLERLIGTVDAPEDLAAEHDHYLYGSPKRRQQPGD